MAEMPPHPTPGKRTLQDLDPSSDEIAPGKRAHVDGSAASVHLTLLEELCDLEGEDDGPCAQPSAATASSQEELVAEIMKSLEKVIEGSESRGTGEASVSCPSSSEASSPSPVPQEPFALDLSWTGDCFSGSESLELSSLQTGAAMGDQLNADAHIRHLLQASDDELGIPVSSSSSDLEENSFHEEWVSLSDEGAAVMDAYCLIDRHFQHLEDSREMYEPVILF